MITLILASEVIRLILQFAEEFGEFWRGKKENWHLQVCGHNSQLKKGEISSTWGAVVSLSGGVKVLKSLVHK